MDQRHVAVTAHQRLQVKPDVALLLNSGPGVLANFGALPIPQPTVTLVDQGRGSRPGRVGEAYPTLWVQLSLQALPDRKRSFRRA